MTRDEFKEVFDKYYDSIRSYIYYKCGDQEIANDVAQDVFMKLWEKDIDPNYVAGLLYKMARDLFISKFRRQKLENQYLSNLEFSFEYNTPAEELEYKEAEGKYNAALEEMSENQRITFLMSRSEGLKYSEIAERLDLSVKAVEKRMNGALSLLKEKLL